MPNYKKIFYSSVSDFFQKSDFYHELYPTKNSSRHGKIIFVSDKKIWIKNQKLFPVKFLQNFSKSLILQDPKAEEKNLNKLLSESKNFDFIIAFGSGTINDLCKLTSAKLGIPYLIIPSAASMNGYLSRNASIKISGHKKTLPATLPVAVLCDLKILSQAPLELTKAGVGDILCFYSCWFDWYLSHKILGTKFDEKPFQILSKKMGFLLKNFSKFSLRDEKFLRLLIEIILLSGLGMTMSGGSYPASQSEHLIAHTMEMKYPKKMHKIFHGNQIAVTTLTSLELQKKLLGFDSLKIKKCDFPQKNIEDFFGKKIAAECKKEFLQKNLTALQTSKINNSLKNNWTKIKKDLSKIYLSPERLKEIFQHFKIKTSPKSLGLSDQEYQGCVTHAKFIRNRFTCLDLLT